jgi:hypothetical protein
MKPTAEMMKSLYYSPSSAWSSPGKKKFASWPGLRPTTKDITGDVKGAAKYGEASSSAETKEGYAVSKSPEEYNSTSKLPRDIESKDPTNL